MRPLVIGTIYQSDELLDPLSLLQLLLSQLPDELPDELP